MKVLACQLGVEALLVPLVAVAEVCRVREVRRIGVDHGDLPADVAQVLQGVARVRGAALPILDGRALLGLSTGAAAGPVLRLRLSGRFVGLRVDRLLGVRQHDEPVGMTQPLLERATTATSLAAVDGELVRVLEPASLCPLVEGIDEAAAW